MAFTVDEVVRVASQSRSWFVLYAPVETGRKQTIHVTGKPREQLRKR